AGGRLLAAPAGQSAHVDAAIGVRTGARHGARKRDRGPVSAAALLCLAAEFRGGQLPLLLHPPLCLRPPPVPLPDQIRAARPWLLAADEHRRLGRRGEPCTRSALLGEDRTWRQP